MNDINSCAVIIQARMSSSRFPKKMLSCLCGIPLIKYVYEHCKRSPIKNILVATSDDESDDELFNYCKRNDIAVIRGSLNNTLERYIQAADSIGAKYIVRVCGDTPFADLSLIDSALSMLIEEKLDYVSFDRQTCAAAFYSEVVTLEALKKTAMLTKAKEDLEYVTKFIIEKKDKFSTRFLDAKLNPESIRQLRLTIDFPEDLQRANAIVDKLEDKFSFTSGDILSVLHKMDKEYRVGEFPRRIEIELTSACNLQCTFCPRKYVDGLDGVMVFDLFKKIIDEAARYPDTILVLHRRGESLFHPDFVDFCAYVKGKFKEIQLATNATLLDDKKIEAIINTLQFISFSIDIPAVFERTRIPAKYSEVEAKILKFLDLNKRKLLTQVSMVKTAETPPENPEIFKRIWQGKVDRIRIYEEHSADGKFGSLMRDRGRRVPCAMPFYEMLIYYDGKIGRCNHDWNGISMGDIGFTTIKDIWNSNIYNELRNQHLGLQIKDETCKNCDSWYPEICNQGTGETLE